MEIKILLVINKQRTAREEEKNKQERQRIKLKKKRRKTKWQKIGWRMKPQKQSWVTT